MSTSETTPVRLSFDAQLAQMDEVVDWCARNESQIGYFAAFFHRIMQLLNDRLDTGYFVYDEFVHAFGVDLVRNYASVVERYADGLVVPPVWQAAFDACTRHPELSQIEYVLAQVRANAFVAMGESLTRVVGSKGDLMAVRNDFVRITDIPRGLLPGLAEVWSKHLPVFRGVYAVLHAQAVKVMREAQREGYVGAWAYARSVIDRPESEWAPELAKFNERVVKIIDGLVRPSDLGPKLLLGVLGFGEDGDPRKGENRVVSSALPDYLQAKWYDDFTPMDMTDYD